jgi:hypothetical protein
LRDVGSSDRAPFSGIVSMSPSTKQLLVFGLGLLLALGVAVISLGVVAMSPLQDFPEILHACVQTGVPASDCRSNAIAAAVFTVATFVGVAACVLWIWRRCPGMEAGAPVVLALATELLLTACFLLIAVHLTLHELGPAYASRIDQLAHLSAFISIEDLLWPLLIQLFLIERNLRMRVAILASLMLILALTPYRAVAFAIFTFAFLLPLFSALCDISRAKSTYSLFDIVSKIAVVSVVGCALLLQGIADSGNRVITAKPQSVGNQGSAIERRAMAQIRQRLAFPPYQAAIAKRLSQTVSLPTITDELERKVHLTDKPNLNEYIYSLIYPGRGLVGETTSLYYGEGAAYFGRAGILWALGAPLLLVVAWALLRKADIDASAILGIALWRSSFAGLITVLPALLLQLAAFFTMIRLGGLGLESSKIRKLARLTAIPLLCSALIAGGIQAWFTLDDLDRRDMLRLEFAAGNGCIFDRASIQSLPIRIEHTLSTPRSTFRSLMPDYTLDRVYLVVPYGRLLKQHLNEFVGIVSNFVQCRTAPSAKIINVQLISAVGFAPLNVLACASAMVAAISFAGTGVKRRFALLSDRPTRRARRQLAAAPFHPGDQSPPKPTTR